MPKADCASKCVTISGRILRIFFTSALRSDEWPSTSANFFIFRRIFRRPSEPVGNYKNYVGTSENQKMQMMHFKLSLISKINTSTRGTFKVCPYLKLRTCLLPATSKVRKFTVPHHCKNKNIKVYLFFTK